MNGRHWDEQMVMVVVVAVGSVVVEVSRSLYSLYTMTIMLAEQRKYHVGNSMNSGSVLRQIYYSLVYTQPTREIFFQSPLIKQDFISPSFISLYYYLTVKLLCVSGVMCKILQNTTNKVNTVNRFIKYHNLNCCIIIFVLHEQLSSYRTFFLQIHFSLCGCVKSENLT